MQDFALAEAINRFGLELYALLRSRPGTLVFSPLSIASGLAAARMGARGETHEQIQAVLHLARKQEGVDDAFTALLGQIGAIEPRRGHTLRLVNALGTAAGRAPAPSVREQLEQHYLALCDAYEFSSAAEAARESINAWAAERSHGRIRELFDAGSLSGGTELALGAGLYFKAQWVSQFARTRTRDAEFHVSRDYAVSVPLMFQEERFNFFEGPTFDAIELPYVSYDDSLLVLLPRDADGLEALERTLTPENLAQWVLELRARQVSVWLPRLRLEACYDLVRVLSDLGLQGAFAPEADFSGFLPEAGAPSLHLSAAVHRAVIEVNEEGKEAAAATNPPIMMSPLVQPVAPASFRADHPFCFLVRHNATGLILFLGRVTNPRESYSCFAG